MTLVFVHVDYLEAGTGQTGWTRWSIARDGPRFLSLAAKTRNGRTGSFRDCKKNLELRKMQKT